MAKKIAFCSFKGGSGRTVALANIAARLANKGKKVGCIDLDIESCGLNEVFKVSVDMEYVVQKYYLTAQHWRYLGGNRGLNFDNREEFRKLVYNVLEKSELPAKIKWSNEFGELWLIPALPNPKWTGFALSNPNIQERTGELFTRFVEEFKLDFLLIDGRSGVSTLILPALILSDHVLMFCRSGEQHRIGTKKMVEWLIEHRRGMFPSISPKTISIIPSAVPSGARENIQKWVENITSQNESEGINSLGLISDYEELRIKEDIFSSSPTADMPLIAKDYDALAEKIINFTSI
jgi:cellulose biosynthesis protein BcsQ